jgi:transcriptional regulator with XRE-family HTH domain
VSERPRSQTYEALGAYVRSQRLLAQLTLRQAAELARISNPYLSQIEHGLALPSITVLSALAEALQVSADALLLRAAGLSAGDETEHTVATESAIRHDPRLDDAQKHALLAVLTSYVTESPARSQLTTKRVNGATPASTRAARRRQPPKLQVEDREPT